MHDQYIQALLEKFHEGKINEEEMRELNDWYLSLGKDRADELFDPTSKTATALRTQRLSELKARLSGEAIPLFPKTKIISLKRFSRIAAILAGICIGSYLLFFIPKKSGDPIVKANINSHFKNDVAPGTNAAVLTLADGSTIVLDSAANGTLAVQENANLVKTANGQLQYNAINAPNAAMEYNTLFVPKGSKTVHLTLSDGTQVWMNSFSSLRYPVVFAATERKVEISGEAYFEVAKDEHKPFIVQKGEVQVQVLGTHFNVNSYDDEADIKVTLLEGSVKIQNANTSKMIKPGEQAMLNVEGKIAINRDVDIDEVMAWKNGRFEFNGHTIDVVMRQLSRWYDVEVEYRGAKPDDHFMGDISRMGNVSEVLKMLEHTEVVRFSIEGKKIVVTRK